MSNPFELAAIYRSHFSLFLQRTFQALNPNTPYLGNWHIEAICHALERCASGEIRRLIITVPPRSLKSICASVAFPAWVLARNPSASFITVSYASLLGNELANQTRNVMSQPWYCRAFPRTRISPLKNTEGHIKTTRGGHRFATSVTGTLTGMGADFIIVDDPLKASEEPSEAALADVTEWMRASLFTRLNNKLTGVIVVIMQRLHDEDPVGYLLEQGGWEHLNLPAIAESETMIPIGPEQFHHRRVGDVIHGARSVLWNARRRLRKDPLREWALRVEQMRGHNKAAAALANKMARFAWAVWRKGKAFELPQQAEATAASAKKDTDSLREGGPTA